MHANLTIDSILRSPAAANKPAQQPDEASESVSYRECRIGIVGAGSEACDLLDYLRRHTSYDYFDFLAIDKDKAALERSGADTQVLLRYDIHLDLDEENLTPLDHIAAQADRNQLRAILKPYVLLFVVAVLGRDTATGIATDIAQVARAPDALTIGVVIPPFSFEAIDRINCAQYGITELEASLDALLVCDPNRFLQQPGCKLRDARAAVNDAALHVVNGVVEPFYKLGLIGLDFSDIASVFGNAGRVAVGFAQASGDNFIGDALEQALRYPLLESIPLSKARRILVHTLVNRNFPITQWEPLNCKMQQEADEDADVKYSMAWDDNLAEDQIIVTIFTTDGGAAPQDEQSNDGLVRKFDLSSLLREVRAKPSD